MPKRSDEFSAEIVLSGLKDFQRRTVEHVFERLRDPNGSRRFLVADEVGLGKTLVARGIIAKTFEASRKKGQRRVDVVYICANSVIAAQNANRLAIPGLKGFATPKRLTLLAKELKRFSDDGLNILCLTPGTNFEMAGSRRGIVMERAVICRLLAGAKELALKKTPLENIFRIGIEDADKWKERVRSLKASDLDPKLSEAFVRAVSNDKKIVAKLY